ncbi:MAG: hypothetical protein HY874_05295 [Chloroflexi bacterium]|nr:hypothetical protein [Chloroflexota bacterium]
MNEQTGAPDYMERKKTRVRIFTQSAIVEGDYSHAPGVRLSDSLRNAASGERYMLLNDVTIRTLHGDALAPDVASAAFVLINTAHATLVIPLESD